MEYKPSLVKCSDLDINDLAKRIMKGRSVATIEVQNKIADLHDKVAAGTCEGEDILWLWKTLNISVQEILAIEKRYNDVLCLYLKETLHNVSIRQ